MNLRERFLEIMNFNPNVHSLKWEFGYWGETIDNWYKEGLPKEIILFWIQLFPLQHLRYTARHGPARELTIT